MYESNPRFDYIRIETNYISYAQRVPASESGQMVKSIRENGRAVWYMLAKDEGHGFRKKENRDRMTEAIALFLEENLLE
tara:strand:- start:5 stop:241 length:237 start_codon:yes stop_codon:yes gene_type:complete